MKRSAAGKKSEMVIGQVVRKRLTELVNLISRLIEPSLFWVKIYVWGYESESKGLNLGKFDVSPFSLPGSASFEECFKYLSAAEGSILRTH